MRHGYYQTPWHVRELADHLEGVCRRDISRLMVHWPPQHGKSMTASELFPAYHLGHRPQDPIIVVSYGGDRALKISRRVRNIVRGARFQKLFPGTDISLESRSVEEWELKDDDGGVKAVGIGGAVTGFGAGLLLIDDPHKNRQEAESEVFRNRVWEAYNSDLYTRLRPDGAIVLIQTRWHEDDLSGRLLEAQGTDPLSDEWLKLHRPALDDNEQALWPERYSVERLKRIRAQISPYDWEALYQGRPTAPEGAMFKRDWFEKAIHDEPPAGLRWAWTWDLAVSTKATGDYTVGCRSAFDDDGAFWISKIVRLRAEWPDIRNIWAQIAADEGAGTEFGIETAVFQLAAMQEVRRDSRFHHLALKELKPDRDKEARARPLQSRAEAKMVKLVRGDWNQAFLAELYTFPLGKHDDQVDAAAYGYLMATRTPAFGVVVPTQNY